MSLAQGLMPAVLGNTSFINSLLVSWSVAVSLLSTTLQNGNSSLGVLPATTLPSFLGCDDSDRVPWGNRTANGTNYYENVPDTGVTRYYDFSLSRQILAPDGVEKEMILVNGQFPGPTLEANWGDWFEITVHNNITGPEEGTTLHWHGLLQKQTPYMDGVPGVSQCPIAPGASMVYRYRAAAYGTSWYHSHYSAQYVDGAYGPLVVYGPSSAAYDVDVGPIMVTDYYHRGYRDILNDVMSTNLTRSQLIVSDNTLIQGKMDYNCSNVSDEKNCTSNAGIAKLQFTPGKIHRLRFINPSAFAVMVVSIDHHIMTVIASDMTPLVPYNASMITLSSGQRMDVLVTAVPSREMANGAYYLRARQPPGCSQSWQPYGLAAIYYDTACDTNEDPQSLPQSEFITPSDLDCNGAPLNVTIPEFSMPVAEPNTTVAIDINEQRNASGNYLYTMNGNTFRADYNDPALLDTQAGNLSFAADPMRNVYNFGDNDTVRIIFYNYVNISHPMHVHGQNMYVLAEGVGEWDGTITRPSNPLRRDTQILQPYGYLVVQLVSDNPGVWPFHCHFAWHASQGLYISVVQKPDDVQNLTEVPGVLSPTCAAWDAYSSSTIVDQIDSGVKMMEKYRFS